MKGSLKSPRSHLERYEVIQEGWQRMPHSLPACDDLICGMAVRERDMLHRAGFPGQMLFRGDSYDPHSSGSGARPQAISLGAVD